MRDGTAHLTEPCSAAETVNNVLNAIELMTKMGSFRAYTTRSSL